MSIKGQTVEARGLEFNVLVEGEGPAVLLVHGFPDSNSIWRNQIPALVEAGYRVIAPDLRGFGESTAPPITRSTSSSATPLRDEAELVAELSRLRSKFTAGSAAVVNPRVDGSHGDRAQAVALPILEHARTGGPGDGGIRAGGETIVGPRSSIRSARVWT